MSLLMRPDFPQQLFPWQAELWQQFQARRTANNMPHAMVLAGAEGVGKLQFADYLATSLVCEATSIETQPCGECKSCRLAKAGTHPDITWLTPEEEGKAIRIDAVRALSQKTVLTTQSQRSRVFIVTPAESMNRASANALLKTLEEPTSATVMLLLTSAPDKLPATIRSRCQNINFKTVPEKMAAEWLQQQSNDLSQADAMAFSSGAPLLALKAIEGGRLAEVSSIVDDLIALKLRKVNPIQISTTWNERPIKGLLNDLTCACSDLVRSASAESEARLFIPNQRENLQSLAKGINLQRLYLFIDEISQLRREMTHNLNPGMILQRLVISWLALTRPEAR